MKKLILILLLLVSVNSKVFSQNYVYEGIDVFSFQKQEGFEYNENVNGHNSYIKNNVGYFESVYIQETQGFYFQIKPSSATGLKWYRIYNDLKELFNRAEDKNDDYIASYIKNYDGATIDDLIISCILGTSELHRIWVVSDYFLFLYCNQKEGICIITAKVND